MKKITPIADEFHMNSASLNLGRKLYALKLTRDQAIDFKSGFSSFTAMASKYGWKNKLQEGETYEGYLAVYYSADQQMVVYMSGSLYKVSPDEEVAEKDLEAQRKQSLWKVVAGIDEEGVFDYVFTLGDYPIAKLVQDLQVYDGLLVNLNPAELGESIKKKLVAALKEESAAELTDAEALAVKAIFGRSGLFAEV